MNDEMYYEETYEDRIDEFVNNYCKYIDIIVKETKRDIMYSAEVFCDYLLGNLTDDFIDSNYDEFEEEFTTYYTRRTHKGVEFPAYDLMLAYFYNIYEKHRSEASSWGTEEETQ